MSKSKRSFVVVVAILTVMLIVLSACGETTDLEKRIDELQQQIADLQQVVDAKDSEIEDLNDRIENLNKRIEDLKKEFREEFSNPAGIYSLQQAFDYGYLTKEDLEQIAYHINNQLSYPQPLESSIETAIKEAAAYEIRNRKIEPFLNATADGFTIVEYYGKYSDCFVVRMRNDYDIYPTDVPSWWEEIGGVQFHFTGHDRIMVWKAK